MRIYFYTATLVLGTALVSCGGNDKEDYVDKDLMKAAAESKAAQKKDSIVATGQTAIPQTIPAAAGSAPITAQPVTIGTNVQPVPSGTVAPTVAAQATAPGMNPPHGQPGHRCDIPVGSPLNSKPATTSAPTGTLTTTTTPAQATAPGMNPPHGQPGHRCDIPVGSPLNSKPAAPATGTISTTPAPPPGATASKSDTAKNE